MSDSRTTPFARPGGRSDEDVSRFFEASDLKRLWYFDGRFLDAEDFRTEQRYSKRVLALANQANGHGVVHGLDVHLGKAALEVSAGLAVNADGDIVQLPQRVSLPIADLIASMSGPVAESQKVDASASSGFGPCSRPTDGGKPSIEGTSRFYVLSVAPAERLCGEEETFGRPCADACTTKTDHSFVIEGVVFRLREFTPDEITAELPGQVRGAVASAWFRSEDRRPPGVMDRGLIEDDRWCRGALPASGSEVDLAIFDRDGGATTWVDQWAVRRELCDTNPTNHWFHATGLRPWTQFLAQVLQFQCQVASCGLLGGKAYPEADQQELEQIGFELLRADDRTVSRYAEFAQTFSALATANSAGRLWYCVGEQFPPCGWLPNIGKRGPCESSYAWFGDEMIAEHFTVRPDYIGQAFQQSQHLDRITRSERDVIDILIPDGSTDWFFFVRRSGRTVHRCGPDPIEADPAADVSEELATVETHWISPTGTPSDPDYPVKANTESGVYHTPESPFYARTRGNRWYASERAARADGLRPPDVMRRAAVDNDTGGQRMRIIGVFGGNDVGTRELQFACDLGGEISSRREWLCLTGGFEPCRDQVKNQAICEPHKAGDGPAWIGVTQEGTVAVETNGPGLVLHTDLGHKRNLLEAFLVDVAVVLPGGDGTASEAVATLCLGKPIVVVGDQTGSPLAAGLEEIGRGSVLELEQRRSWIETARRRLRRTRRETPIDELVNQCITTDALDGANSRIKRLNGLDVAATVEALDALLIGETPNHHCPAIDDYEKFAEAFTAFVGS